MSDIRELNTFLYYYNEANKISPSQLGEKLGVLYLDRALPHTFKNYVEGKVTFETSFTSYSGMKVHVSGFDCKEQQAV